MKPIVLGDCCLIQNDCLAALRAMPDSSVDSVVTDPPAGIGFMSGSGGKKWDAFESRAEFIGFMTNVMAECRRVLKPGGHAFVWALPRTAHWTAMGVEDGGLQIRDVISAVTGRAFAKGLNIAKAIDEKLGCEPSVVGSRKVSGTARIKGGNFSNSAGRADELYATREIRDEIPVTEPTSPEAKKWNGWYTGLSPKCENWILARKAPEGTLAENVLKHGTGGIHVDACRVASGPSETHSRSSEAGDNQPVYGKYGPQETHQTEGQKLGRWPANVVFCHSPGCRKIGTQKVRGTKSGSGSGFRSTKFCGSVGVGEATGSLFFGFADADGKETIPVWECQPGCPVAELDRQSGFSSTKRIEKPSDCGGNTWGGTIQVKRGARGHTDSGGASRFVNTFEWDPEHDMPFVWYQKAPPKERSCNGTVDNGHPTLKPVSLMRHLVRLITPPGGLVLDPFMGSGTTGIACVEEGFRFIGVERESDYIRIAHARIAYALGLLTQGTESPKDKDDKEGEG